MPIFNISQNFVVVPCDFIEKLMPKANPTFVKVYLYALMLASRGESVDSEVIAKKLELLESDVLQAMRYFEEKGVFSGAENQHKITAEPEEIQNREDLKEMLMLAQEVLGKTLSSTDTKTLYWIHENLGFPMEVVLVLLEYCVSINKRAMSYIEQVAISWHDRGITTLEEADSFLKAQADKSEAYLTIKKIFGINSRDFTSIEKNYINTWLTNYGMTEEMVALAYEYSILRINKLSFPYIDKIIEQWFKKGIHTIADAEADNDEFKNSQARGGKGFELMPDEETDEFEKIMWEKMNNED